MVQDRMHVLKRTLVAIVTLFLVDVDKVLNEVLGLINELLVFLRLMEEVTRNRAKCLQEEQSVSRYDEQQGANLRRQMCRFPRHRHFPSQGRFLACQWPLFFLQLVQEGALLPM